MFIREIALQIDGQRKHTMRTKMSDLGRDWSGSERFPKHMNQPCFLIFSALHLQGETLEFMSLLFWGQVLSNEDKRSNQLNHFCQENSSTKKIRRKSVESYENPFRLRKSAENPQTQD